MSIAGIFGSSVLSLLSPNTQTPLQKTKQEFQQLGQDLKSGNLSAAQSDITALQQNVAQQSASASTTAPISASQTGSAISQDFAKLSTDLKSGNLTAAQADYTSLVQVFQSQGAQSQISGHHHHHHAGGSDPNDASSSSSSTTSSGTSSTTASPAQLFTDLGQALQSSNLSAAQQAYSLLQQDFQQLAPASSALNSSSATTGTTGISVNA
jgi:epidermal growth factor receptor substrate 15